MNLWASFTSPPRKASRQRALQFRPYDPRLPFRPAAGSSRTASRRRRAPPVLRAVPKPRPGTLAKLIRQRPETRRPAPLHFTDIGTVGYSKHAHDQDTSQVQTIDAYLSKVPVVGSVGAKAVEIITGLGLVAESIFSSGNAAGLSQQQLDAIDAGIKRGGVVATGSVLNQVEGRAGTKQLFDPDAPGGYRTVGGRFME